MVDPWAWMLSNAQVVIGWGVTLAVAVAGWVITAIRDGRAAKRARLKAEADAAEADRRFNERLDVLKRQLQAADETAEGLREQVEAQKATAEAAQAQVAQMVESNRLYAAANPEDKAPWGDAVWSGRGSLFIVRNESSRRVTVTGVHASDSTLDSFLSFDRELPIICEPGDTLEYLALGTWQSDTPDALIDWHWEGSGQELHTRRVNIKS